MLPAPAPSYVFLFDTLQFLRESGKDVSVLFLEYTTAPTARYPRQLEQGAALVEYVVNKLGKHPSNVILMGDSAGGNLLLGVFSHMLHPHPQITPLKLNAPLRAAVLLSPWCSFETTSDSFSRNKKKDCVDARGVRLWSADFLGSASTDPYNQPRNAPTGWWDNLSKCVEKILVVGGSDEVFIDDIKYVGVQLDNVMNGVCTVSVVAGGSHDQPNLDLLMGFRGLSDEAKIVRGFLSALTEE